MSERLQLITRELFKKTTAAELTSELEDMLSVYVQHAAVDRLQLSNVSRLTCNLIVTVQRLEDELNRSEPIENDTYS